MGKKRAANATKNAAEQRIGYEIGYGKPPVDCQSQPGVSGNPNGPPKHRTNLWVWFCKYMEMTDGELAMLDSSKLTAAQQTALTLVMQAKSGEGCGAERMARYIIDREEGRAVEHVIIDEGTDLTDQECEELRKLIRENHGRDAN